MWSPQLRSVDPRYESREQVAARWQALSQRIDGLSRALGVDLHDGPQLQALLRDAAPEHAHTVASRSALSGSDRRIAHKRVELCGLVVMRYALTRHTIDVLGLSSLNLSSQP